MPETAAECSEPQDIFRIGLPAGGRAKGCGRTTSCARKQTHTEHRAQSSVKTGHSQKLHIQTDNIENLLTDLESYLTYKNVLLDLKATRTPWDGAGRDRMGE